MILTRLVVSGHLQKCQKKKIFPQERQWHFMLSKITVSAFGKVYSSQHSPKIKYKKQSICLSLCPGSSSQSIVLIYAQRFSLILNISYQEKVTFMCFEVLFLNTEKAKKIKETVMLKSLFLVCKVIVLYFLKNILDWGKTKIFRKARLPAFSAKTFLISQQYIYMLLSIFLPPFPSFLGF